MKKRVFAACPLRPEFDDLYLVIKQIAESLGASVLRPDELNNRHYFIDLVFYHRIVKCFVLIDLKRGFLMAIKFERDENVPTLYEFIVVFRS
jgi:hypothetical protein